MFNDEPDSYLTSGELSTISDPADSSLAMLITRINQELVEFTNRRLQIPSTFTGRKSNGGSEF